MRKAKNKKITEVDRYLFGNGTHYEIYEKLGAHPMTINGKKGVYFAVWAPHAASVSLVGDFNGWNPDANHMTPLEDSGIYEIFSTQIRENELYKYAITTHSGKVLFKADPYANYAEFRPGTASVVTDLSRLKWTDQKWIERRAATDLGQAPMAIYEVHLGSWKRHEDTNGEGYYNYREAAKELGEYVKKMGYTHVELIGIAEHPYDGSWGYQVTGYYAPTSRYGSPEDFAWFVNHLHSKGIGVILDWVPAHFPRDAHGLADFDGEALYEYTDPRKGEHPDWGTKIFDYSKYEVLNFLIANALFWVEKFHVDGLRVDAVASMLYLDYGKQDGQWVPNIYGGNENLEACKFFSNRNSIMTRRTPGAMMIAEESTAWPKVTDTAENGGLGFSFKWNMGWMHDFLEYMKLDPYFRKYNHNKMTFSMTYSTSERFVLVLSHDEVVHLKCSMINKMPGLYDDKFANLKVAYTYMLGHPGKKLLFMGQDFGQWSEWNEETQLDWYLLNEDKHQELHKFVGGLLKLYKNNNALYSHDYDWDGFEWINCDDADRSIFSFVRKNEKGGNFLFVCNFTPVAREDYRVGVISKRKHLRLVDEQNGLVKKMSDAPAFKPEAAPCDGKPYSISFPLNAYGIAIFRF